MMERDARKRLSVEAPRASGSATPAQVRTPDLLSLDRPVPTSPPRNPTRAKIVTGSAPTLNYLRHWAAKQVRA